MHLMPDAKQIAQIAESMGAIIGEEEAEQYRPHLIELLGVVDQFMQTRTAECPPQLLFPDRAPGYRPGLAEDKHFGIPRTQKYVDAFSSKFLRHGGADSGASTGDEGLFSLKLKFHGWG